MQPNPTATPPEPAHRSAPLARTPRGATWVLAGSLVACLAVFAASRAVQVERARARFDAAVTDAQGRLAERLRVCEDLLRSVRGLVQAGERLDRRRFREFLGAMDLPHRYPGLMGVAYGVPVPPGGADGIEQRLRDEHGDPSLSIHPGIGFEGDAVILYEEPEEPNRAALGFNSASSDDQRIPLLAARDTGDVRASAPMPLAQAPAAGPGLVLRLAIYGARDVPDGVGARRAAFSGYVNAVFLLRELAAGAAQRVRADGIRVRMQDVTDASSPRDFLDGGDGAAPGWWHRFGPGPLRTATMQEVGGRRWTLAFETGPAFFQGSEVGIPWLTTGGVLAIGLLLAALVRSISQTGRRARDLAERMTERLRLSESRLRAIARVMPDVLAVIDGDGRLVEVHAGDPDHLAAPPADLAGRRLDDVMPPDLARQARDTIRAALDTGHVQSLEYALDTRKGPMRFEARVAAMGIEDDGKPCAIWVSRDVTERRAHEEAHLQAQKLESLGLLAGGIAHDFNNLLAAILGYLSLGRMAMEEDRDPTSHLDRMETSVRRASDLARQLLAYSGHAAFHVEPVDLNALIDEMGGLIGVSNPRKIRVDLQPGPGLPRIRADRTQLQQVVMNLITNATEAIDKAEGRVVITTSGTHLDAAQIERRMPGQGVEPGRFVTLAVEDDGCGMEPAVRARIFDPFFTTKPSGRGLGLSALRGILRAHRAGIELDSEPGRGTRFALHFPALAPGEAADVRTEAAISAVARPLTGTLLIADDEPFLRDTSRRMAEHLGMSVVEAIDGEQAWATFEARREGLAAAMLDLTMPRLGGADVYRRIRSAAPSFPIVLCSGYSREALPELADPHEPTAFLQKPYGLRDFEATLRKVTGRPGGE